MSKGHIVQNYTFDASAKTITFADYSSISLSGVKLITNVTDNILIYDWGEIGFGGTVSGNVLTLAYDTTAMSDSDTLMVIYAEPTDRDADQALLELLDRLIRVTRSPAYSTNLNVGPALRVVFDAANSTVPTLVTNTLGTVSSVTSVTAVTNVNGLNSLDSRHVIWNGWNAAYQLGLRNRIT